MSRLSAALVLVASAALSEPAPAQHAIRVGQPQAGTFQFVPLQVGDETGIFRQHGVDVEVISFGGGPRVQQALAAGSIDIGIGSGPECDGQILVTPDLLGMLPWFSLRHVKPRLNAAEQMRTVVKEWKRNVETV